MAFFVWGANLVSSLQFFVFILFALFLSQTSAHASTVTSINCLTNYDFIIVGGGTAGLALATRLSQDLSQARILVIEAGPAALTEPKINIPGLKGSTIGGPYDWNFTTVPQSNVNNRVLPTTRGKVLGGSQALNLMTWDRASAAEYDVWQELGNPGWNWSTMIDSMLKVETFTGADTSTYGSAGVGSNGPIRSVINRVMPAQQSYWIPTGQNLGVPNNLNSLGGNPIGIMDQPSNVDPSNYTRSYSANAYLPIAGPNLSVMESTRVAKINFQPMNGSIRATGVTLEDGTVIGTTKEVILSAGSIQSPGLLEVSGIGQEAVLQAAGVPSVLNLPGVGENLQDHLRVQSSYILKPNYTSFDALKYNATYAAEQMALYEAGQVSEYDYTGSGYQFISWQQALGNASSSLISLAQQAANASSPIDKYKLQYLTPDSSSIIPELETIFSDGYTGTKGYPANTSAEYGINTFSLISAVLHPFSRGSVHINSASIDSAPAIDPNYLSNEYDIQALVAAAKKNRQIAQTMPLAGAWTEEYEPGLNNVTTDADWRNYVLDTAVSIYHPLGTCAMLPLEDGGVVDPNLKVYGTANLRVVDASIMPIIIGAHLQTSILGIAEMAAQRISAQYGGAASVYN
ncbi:GMC oxidoreductase [Viridothelium virens]|uniref:GMC oxidoreductase n=1 Tax=Viridothelium virens TaxID=1048519 RepID=A0A6A6H407_VIRVR|nr:GMC oxidoreductase [Viridothelium virens]